MEGLLIWGIILLLFVLLILLIAYGKSFTRHAGIAHLTAFHDWQPDDKQKAIEHIIERNAGSKMEDDESEGAKKIQGIKS